MGKSKKSKKQAVQERPALTAMDVVVSLVPAVFIAGLRTFAAPCEHTDGSPVACKSAGFALLCLGILAVALILMRLIGADKHTKRSFDFFLFVVGILIAVLPGTTLDLCVGEGMRCLTVMLPFARIAGALLALAALACELTVDHEEPTGRKRRR